MRIKKRVKKRVKKGIKSVKSAPPEVYVAGGGVLVGGAAVVLLATTKSGRELLARTAQVTGWLEADEPDAEESDVQEEEAHGEPADDADVDEEPEKDTNGDDGSRPTNLKPQRKERPKIENQRKDPAPVFLGRRAQGTGYVELERWTRVGYDRGTKA